MPTPSATGSTSGDADDAIVTACAKGKASLDFAEELEAAGYDDVTVVADGMRGWSGVYDRTAVPLPDAGDDPLDIVQIQRRAKGCLGYLVVGGRPSDEKTDSDGSDRVAVAVDVSRHGDEWREAAAERDVAYDFEPLARNETLDVGGVDVKALATPGHTDDGASYLVGGSALLTGDTLFTDSVGRTELQFAAGGEEKDGDDAVSGGENGGESESAGAAIGAERLYDSLHGTLLAEPDEVVVCPGHFAVANDGTTGDVVPGEPVTTTVGAARRGLDVLGLDREAFVERITATLPEKPPNYEAVIAANRGVESLPDETAAIELELGPNRCAADAGGESTASD